MIATPPSRSQPPARIRSIQYLRAIAALAVVALHASERVDAYLPAALDGGLHLGHAGVDLFFVISGFIMWSIGREAPSDPLRFLARRAIRVVPPYWIATSAWVAVMLLVGAQWIAITPAHVGQSLLFVPHWSPTFPDRFWPVLVPGWTLIFEMFFYGMFALSLLAAGMRRLGVLTALLLALVLAGVVIRPNTAVAAAYTSPLLLEFLSGCFVAEVLRRWPGGAVRGAGFVVVGLLVLAVLGSGAATDQTSWSRPMILGLACVLIVAGTVGLEDRLPDLPLLERLGDASYAIYLFHLFLLVPLAQVWQMLPQVHGPLGAIVFVVVAMGLASVMGILLFDRMERPLQRRLNGLAFGRTRRPPLVER
ncbi:MAG: acyltransferase [Jannaschia sp.]